MKSATDLWGKDSYETEKMLKKEHGAATGVLTIGQSGENICRISTVVSQEGRAGGRPGMGAVMGSKNLKAIIIKGTGEIPVADKEALQKMGGRASRTSSRDPTTSTGRPRAPWQQLSGAKPPQPSPHTTLGRASSTTARRSTATPWRRPPSSNAAAPIVT